MTSTADPGRSSESPWYRQFWPWFLLALLLSVVTASFVTVYIALRDRDGTVPEYLPAARPGIPGTERQLPERANGAVHYNPTSNLLIARLSDPPRTGPLRLTLVHPTRSRQDTRLIMEAISETEWTAQLPAGYSGNLARWRWVLTAGDGSQRMTGRFHLQE